MNRNPWAIVAGLLGASGVGIGAYAAHGMTEGLTKLGLSPEEALRRVEEWVRPAVQYQLIHAVALMCLALVVTPDGRQGSLRLARWAFTIGISLFCGMLYVMTLGDERFKILGAVVPLGGLSFIVGWLCVAAAGMKPTGEATA